ncbi:MAG TPA: hypothetical protein DDY93_11635, partial [Dehalococcoidia bacterium]|nr:hypothetical protein [Dehalococcoidia bacterium]
MVVTKEVILGLAEFVYFGHLFLPSVECLIDLDAKPARRTQRCDSAFVYGSSTDDGLFNGNIYDG